MRSFLLASILLAVPAWATGERVILVPSNNPLRDMVCISMTCVNGGGRDVVVSSKPTRAGVEFTVTTAGGQVRLVHTAPAKADGRVSSTDLVHASSLVIRAIEGGPIAASEQTPSAAPAPAKKKKVAVVKKKAKLRLVASAR